MTDPGFGLEEQTGSDRTVVRLSGDLDVVSAPALRDRLVEIVQEVRLAIVDLSGVDFIDSSGMSALVTAHKRAVSSGGRLVVVCPPGSIRRLIEVVSLDQVFRLCASVDEVDQLED